jgi:hypothetical protein
MMIYLWMVICGSLRYYPVWLKAVNNPLFVKELQRANEQKQLDQKLYNNYTIISRQSSFTNSFQNKRTTKADSLFLVVFECVNEKLFCSDCFFLFY